MNKKGPVVIIEDDPDDQHMLAEVFNALGYPNPVVFFVDGNAALAYLNTTDTVPFLILSDVNIPRVNGFELRNLIRSNEKPWMKSIPYLFFTTSSDKQTVQDAYAMSVQGFFVKPSSYGKLEDTIKKIMEYWNECLAPNEFKR